jgi:hypothetical protein
VRQLERGLGHYGVSAVIRPRPGQCDTVTSALQSPELPRQTLLDKDALVRTVGKPELTGCPQSITVAVHGPSSEARLVQLCRGLGAAEHRARAGSREREPLVAGAGFAKGARARHKPAPCFGSWPAAWLVSSQPIPAARLSGSYRRRAHASTESSPGKWAELPCCRSTLASSGPAPSWTRSSISCIIGRATAANTPQHRASL